MSVMAFIILLLFISFLGHKEEIALMAPKLNLKNYFK